MTRKGLPSLYAVFASVWILLIAIILPPIQAPDEGEHLVRADLICRGQPLAARLSDRATGGTIDLGAIDAINRFYPLINKSSAAVGRAMYAPIAWGAASPWSFPDTALYPPVLYVPAAAALCIGKRLGWDVLASARLARVSMALVSVSISTVALYLAGSAGLWLFALLLLPTSAGLMACISQDGPMIALAALAVGLVVSLQSTSSKKWPLYLVLLGVDITLLGTARPPYASLVLLPLATSVPSRRARWTASLLALTAITVWWAYCATHILISVNRTAGVNASAQLSGILAHPWRVPTLLFATIQANFLPDYAGYFVTTFSSPDIYTGAAWAVLALAATWSVTVARATGHRHGMIVMLSVGMAAAGIFAIQYLTWTPLGSSVIDGVLARYFIPLAMISILAVQPTSNPKNAWFTTTLGVPVVAFPLVSIVFTMHRIVLRYYMA